MTDNLHQMNKIEIVAQGQDLPLIKDIFASLDTGYTLIENVSGFGHHGYHQGRLMFNELASQVLIISIVPAERVEVIMPALIEHFKTHPGVVFVSEVKVGRADYFLSAGQQPVSLD